MMGARIVGWGAALLVLSSAGVAAATDAVAVARPADRIVVSADVGGGWMQTSFRFGGPDLSLSAPTFNAKAMVGYRAGALDVGFVTGGMLTSSFAADATSAQPAPVPPDSLRLVHAGGFVGWRPSRAQRLSIGGRLEGAYAWLPRTSAYPAFPGAGEAAVGTATAYGAIGAFDVAYAPISTPRASVVIGLELFAGALRGEYGDSLRILPRGAAASVGVRWQ